MLKLILEIIFTVAFAVCCVLSIITGSWLLAVLDGACVILGLINIYLICRYRKREKVRNISEDA
jgi:hypothetical protein